MRQIPPPSNQHPGTRNGNAALSRETPSPSGNLTFGSGSGAAQTFGPGTVPTEEILNEAACPRISSGLGPGQDGLHVVLETSLALLV